jgi:hypothetical protein
MGESVNGRTAASSTFSILNQKDDAERVRMSQLFNKRPTTKNVRLKNDYHRERKSLGLA